ncbi:unnamed protein product [Gongylonema pulchrum]|uniref:Uncharacterized protein n=1 Tax=Gongylonema pulchrum TaxID=637853 RepID=A0A183DRE2_9BILA|nr:unnamed protein product [Gongylonema pulchrum]
MHKKLLGKLNAKSLLQYYQQIASIQHQDKGAIENFASTFVTNRVETGVEAGVEVGVKADIDTGDRTGVEVAVSEAAQKLRQATLQYLCFPFDLK